MSAKRMKPHTSYARPRVNCRPDFRTMLALDAAFTAEGVNQALTCLAELIERSTLTLERLLTRAQWNYCREAFEEHYSGSSLHPVFSGVGLAAELRDAAETVCGPNWRKDVDVAMMVGRVAKVAESLSDLEVLALLLAVRHGVSVTPVDWDREDWWRIEHRYLPSVQERKRQRD